MPDQSSAATEHAILQEITAPLATLPDDPVSVVVNADFPVAMRGYDRLAVDAYVQQTSQLVAELQATRSPEAAVRRALERLGEQISGVLQRAHETAEQITAQSRSEAEDRLVQSRIEAAEITAAAQQRVTDLDVDTDRIWAERRQIVDDARELAHKLLTLAETAAERFPAAETAPYDDQATTTTRAPFVVEPVRTQPPLDAEDMDEPEGGFVADEPEGGFVPDEPAGAFVRDEPEGAFADDEPEGAFADDEPEPPYDAEPEAEPLPGAEVAPGRRTPDDDIDATVAFKPIDPDAPADREQPAPAETPSPSPEPRDRRPSNSVIPPASQAANRRTAR